MYERFEKERHSRRLLIAAKGLVDAAGSFPNDTPDQLTVNEKMLAAVSISNGEIEIIITMALNNAYRSSAIIIIRSKQIEQREVERKRVIHC